MSHTSSPVATAAPLTTADKEKRHAALSSVVWSLALTVLKLVAGLATNSLGLLSEALHSGLDLIAAGITYCAVRVAARPADPDHPYGYGKIENLSALVETLLLLLTCIWIVYEAINRLFFATPEVEPSWWGIAVIIFSIAVDVSRSRMLSRVAKKHNSQALEADALHFSTDILSSVVVLIGLLGLWGASLLPEGTLRALLEKTDALAALMVSGIVVWVGINLCRKSVSVLLDGGGKAHTIQLERALAVQLPLYTVKKLRVRESGAHIFADLTMTASGALSLEAAHDITRMVEDVARDVMPGADVTVHVEPSQPGEQSLLAVVHAVASAHGLSVHSLTLDDNDEQGLCVYLHVEAPSHMPLHTAHERVDAFEHSLSQRMGAARIVSHIEPDDRMRPSTSQHPTMSDDALLGHIQHILAVAPPLPAPHDLTARRIAGVNTVSFHCTVPGSLSVAEAHELANTMEHRLRTQLPALDCLNIHMEPEYTPRADS